MCGCESWTIQKAERRRIDAFELWCWRRLLRVLWTARRSNQSILKEVNPEYLLEELMLKFQYFGHLIEEPTHWKRPWCWERLKAGRAGSNRGWDGWMASLTKWPLVWANSWEIVKDGGSLACCSPWGHKELDRTERLKNSNTWQVLEWSPYDMRVASNQNNQVPSVNQPQGNVLC